MFILNQTPPIEIIQVLGKEPDLYELNKLTPPNWMGFSSNNSSCVKIKKLIVNYSFNQFTVF